MSHLRLLFWLKWKLMWRGYRRDKASALGVIFAIIFFLPMAIGLAIGCAAGFFSLQPPMDEHLLRAVLLGVYLFWLFAPLMGYSLNESYDITKLFVYPLSLRQIFTGTIFGSLVDFPVAFLLPTLIAVLVGFTHNAITFVCVLISVALFLFHTLSLSQAVILASAGMLRSRRFRDVMMVLIPLFWIGYYVASQSLSRQLVKIDWMAILNSTTWDVVNFLPSGFAARSIAAAERGEYSLALAFLLGLAAFSVGTIYLAGWLIQMVYVGEDVSLVIRRRKHAIKDKERPAVTSPVPRPSSRASLFDLRLPVVSAVADKELKYIFRDPYFKFRMMNLVYLLVIAVFMFLGRATRANLQNFRPATLWFVSVWVLMSEMQMSFNIFGTEGGAATVLFLFPSSRRHILIGKNLTLFAALSVVNLAFMVILCALAGVAHLFAPLFCWMELATVVFIAIGNLTSVYLPYRVVMRGMRTQQQTAGRGCGYGFIYMGVSLLAFALLLPVLAALVLPTFWIAPTWFALTIPLAGAYVIALYALLLHLAEPLLIQREVDIMEKVGQAE